MKENIFIKGASEHNLKQINVTIPRNKLIVFTGVSGSGKSSLAFDTLYAEGQRRYVESLSAYARQFLGQMEKPKVDYIEGLSPAISIEQKASSKNPRSTVGTVTEIYDYLRILFARIGQQHCPHCDKEIGAQTVDQMIEHIMKHGNKTKLQILAPLVQNRKGTHSEILDQVRQDGFARIKINGVERTLEEDIVLDKKSKHTIEVVVDRIVLKKGIEGRLTDSLETAMKLAEGMVKIDYIESETQELLSETNACPDCGIGFEELAPQHFSFNSPIGACPACNGLGYKLEIDPDLVVPNKKLSLKQGAVEAWGPLWKKRDGWTYQQVKTYAEEMGFSLETPWKDLTKEVQDFILNGKKRKKFRVKWERNGSVFEFDSRHEGIINTLKRRMRNTQSEGQKRFYMKYVSDKPCTACMGTKLKPQSMAVRIKGKNITEITAMTIAGAEDFFDNIGLTGNQSLIAEEVLKEVKNRLGFLMSVGLHYLTLDRRSPTLSGGEAQRIRLASQIGSQLVGVMYILDEPSIGLHQRDNDRLIHMLTKLRDLGNTVIVVEHDEDTIRMADQVVDFGPRAGIFGGNIVAQGTVEDIINEKNSLTGQYLSGKLSIAIPEERLQVGTRKLSIKGAQHNNLKGINVDIPLGMFVCVTGVSGSGKSSLINQTLYPAVNNHFNRSSLKVGKHDKILGLEHIDKIIGIDQQPIGRTPRSNPSTYIKLFDFIRTLFSQLPTSKIRGYKPGRFSFNVKGGRCEACQGAGVKKIEMHFLSDVYVTCEACKGKRYNNETLSVKYKGLSISEVLDLDVQQGIEYFENFPSIRKKLQTLHDVGLDYIKLGQPSTTLSGGEAQRIKLSKELSKTSTGNTLYVLDEPTTGLHFDDINRLMKVLQRLVAMGNSVIVIEHNMDVIKMADYIIDLGPEGGGDGGKIVTKGTPEQVAKVRKSYTGQYLKGHLPKK